MKTSLNYFIEKIKGVEHELYITLLVILVGMIGFGLGRLSRIEDLRTPIVIKNEAVMEKALNSEVKAGKFVASKTGKSYYLPWCAGVGRIKDSNKVWFDSAEEAAGAGYTPATSCKGL